jgi:Protein of unknown function (DUF2778)
MPSRAATFSDVTAYNLPAATARHPRRNGRAGRTTVGSAVLGLGSVSAVALMAGTATVAAAWMVSNTLAGNPSLRASAPFALQSAAALPLFPQRLSESPDLISAALASASPAYTPPQETRDSQLAAANTTEQTHEYQLASAETVAIPPAPLAPAPTTELRNSVPIPAPHALSVAPIPVKTVVYRAPSVAAVSAVPQANIELHEAPPVVAAPRVRPAAAEPRMRPHAAATPAPSAPLTAGSITMPAAAAHPQLAYNSPETPSAVDSHTAIYDIVAHTVYLPDGERLEAHSGLGRMLDDPQYVSAKARGPTPPNAYDLTLRSGMFHGVQAIRLNPVGDNRMYGRDGILAHTYMLGPSGQSFGCVSFKNYGEFLRAFERGEVNRMVVVTHLPSPPPGVRADRGRAKRYAFDLDSEH